jgi:hypothetical protein
MAFPLSMCRKRRKYREGGEERGEGEGGWERGRERSYFSYKVTNFIGLEPHLFSVNRLLSFFYCCAGCGYIVAFIKF